MSHEAHQFSAQQTPVRVGILTISDTRTSETDASGQWLKTACTEAGHTVVHYALVPDDPAAIQMHVAHWRADTDVLITSGGTGLSARDQTFEALQGLLEQTLPGFGELFRMLSFQEIGSAAMLSRAMAGRHQQMMIFSVPGSAHAVKLAATQLIFPQLRHLVWELRRHRATT